MTHGAFGGFMKRSGSPPIERVVVRAPATIANLGPGFDCLGVAIAWHNEVRVEREPSGELHVTAAGHGADEIPRDETNLAVRAIASVLGSLRGLRVHLTNAIPFGRGFGSSAATIVAGALAGHALRGDGPDLGFLVRAAAAVEGHADNAAPCVYGGAVVVSGDAVLPLGVPPGTEVIVCVAPTALSTEASRKALPVDVPFAVAAANAARSAMLAAALARGETGLMLAATEDLLHQPSRFALMPDSGRLVQALRGEGIAAFLSGAGPSIAALVPQASAASVEVAARRVAPEVWDVRRVSFDRHGAHVVERA